MVDKVFIKLVIIHSTSRKKRISKYFDHVFKLLSSKKKRLFVIELDLFLFHMTNDDIFIRCRKKVFANKQKTRS